MSNSEFPGSEPVMEPPAFAQPAAEAPAAESAHEADADAPVLYSGEGAVAILTLNRADQMNSLTVAAKIGLREGLRKVAADSAVRCVVVTGSGRAFCAGQDLAEHAKALEEDPTHAFDTVADHYAPIVELLTSMPKPVIAAINGTCAGAGLGFALACDIRVAVAGVKFAPAFTGIGLTADSGLSTTLARAVGWSKATEMLMLGTVLDAEEALRVGLVHQVVDRGEFDAHVSALAGKLAAGPTLAYAALKEAAWKAVGSPLGQILELEGQLQHRLAETEDHRGAVRAFLAKERPSFEGL